MSIMIMKKCLDKFEQFIVLFMMWCIIYKYMAMFLLPILGVMGYYIIVVITAPRFLSYNRLLRQYWDHPEDCPRIYWCEKLTKRLFDNGKIGKIRKS